MDSAEGLFQIPPRYCLIDIIQAFGWMLVTDSQSVVDNDIRTFMLVRRPGSLAVTQDDLVYCIAIHFFLIKIRTWTVAGTNEPCSEMQDQVVACIHLGRHCRPINFTEPF